MAKKENTDRWFISISRLWVVAFVAFPLLWSACSGSKNEVVKGFEDAAEVPTLRTLDVMTLISDSGVTRYRMEAEEWLMYDRKRPSYWAFEKGVYLEQFDSLFNVGERPRAILVFPSGIACGEVRFCFRYRGTYSGRYGYLF